MKFTEWFYCTTWS